MSKLDDLVALVKQLEWLKQLLNYVESTLLLTIPLDGYPMLNEIGGENTKTPQVYVANTYSEGRQSNQQLYNHDLSSNKYNLWWKNHQNLMWGN